MCGYEHTGVRVAGTPRGTDEESVQAEVLGE